MTDPSPRTLLEPRAVWRAAWVVVAVVVLALMARWFFSSASTTIFILVMALFFAMAIEPLVARLARRMPRTLATTTVLLGLGIAIGVFFYLFGSMLVEQISSLIAALPDAVDTVIAWVNRRFNTSYRLSTLIDDLGVTDAEIKDYISTAAGSLLSIIGGLAASAFAWFAFLFFAAYLSAGMPRLRRWIAGLMPAPRQVVFLTVWQTMLTKVGGYVGARMILAVINSTAMGIFMYFIDMPSWLPLAIWTGLVAQFVPNIGTYISIALPVLVGFASPDPTDGLWVLLYAIAYQQVENLTIEPRVSARAVDVHPAVSFASALMGAQAFGLAGALLGVPVAATVMAIFDMYRQRYDVTVETEQAAADKLTSHLREVEEAEREDEEATKEPDPLAADISPEDLGSDRGSSSRS